jgi:hypothetical protein
MKIHGFRDGPVSRFHPRKNRIWEFLGSSGEMGLISPKNWTPSLADESSTPGKRLAEARQASHLANLGKVMTHP